MLAELGGRHSRKTAASTGRLPPTPRPRQAYKAQVLSNGQYQEVTRGNEPILPNPVGPTASSETKGTTEEKRRVESRSSTDGIRSNTPERGTDNQTNEKGTGSETGISLGNTKFLSHGTQGESNTL